MTNPTTTENRTFSDIGPDAHPDARPSYDDINTPVIVLIGVISAVVTLLTIWAVEGLYYHWHSRLVRERNYDVANPRQADLINAQKELLIAGDEEKKYLTLESVIPDVIAKYKINREPDEAASSDKKASRDKESGNGGDH